MLLSHRLTSVFEEKENALLCCCLFPLHFSSFHSFHSLQRTDDRRREGEREERTTKKPITSPIFFSPITNTALFTIVKEKEKEKAAAVIKSAFGGLSFSSSDSFKTFEKYLLMCFHTSFLQLNFSLFFA